ncbi:hypothetical protein GCM10009839_86850 [Catenulispora yoronensis]|uniref:Lipoprotein n=1 Tax=Catenulispora yoronensis TaxID=450799 RepID=A0ABN2VHA1_9ACTN
MRRPAAAVILAAGLALAASGCGVQSTGVNTSKTAPFSTTASSGSPSTLPSEARYPVPLVLFTGTSSNAREVTCYLPKEPKTVTDLVQMLAGADEEQCGEGYVTYVPADLALEKTDVAHEYRVTNPLKLHPFALLQLTCSFDRYWRNHPDGKASSTLFDLPLGGSSQWQDCLYLLGSPSDPKLVGKPTAVTPSPGAVGN